MSHYSLPLVKWIIGNILELENAIDEPDRYSREGMAKFYKEDVLKPIQRLYGGVRHAKTMSLRNEQKNSK